MPNALATKPWKPFIKMKEFYRSGNRMKACEKLSTGLFNKTVPHNAILNEYVKYSSFFLNHILKQDPAKCV